MYMYMCICLLPLQIAELSELREEVISRVQKATSQALKYCGSFSTYSYLWVDDRQHFLAQFLLYGHVPTTDELEAAGECVCMQSCTYKYVCVVLFMCMHM